MTGEVEKEGFADRPGGDQPVHEEAGSDLGRELRAGRVRHGRGDGCSRSTISGTSSSRASTACPSRLSCGPKGNGCPATRPASRTMAPGRIVNSGEFDGLSTDVALERMSAAAEERGIGERTVQYRLKDWGISRQRYWGTPIPVVYCDTHGMVPVPPDDLPIELPRVAAFSGRGDSPLAQIPEFVNTTCPECGGPARARDGHDGHVRRLVLVFLPVLRPEEHRPAVRSREGLLTGGRSISTAEVSSTRSCTSSTRASSRVCFATSA